MPVKRSAPEKLGPVVSAGRAISYQRVSTQGQATEDKSSFQRQQDAFDAWCAAHPDHPPLETYRVARSGAESGRFDWLMDGVRRGDFRPGDVLVVESINRFGREAMADTLENLFEIWRTGIKTAFCDHKEGRIFDKASFNCEGDQIFTLAGKITAARDLHVDRKKWSRGGIKKNHQAIYDGRLNDSHFKPRQPGKRALYPFWLDFHPELNRGLGGFKLNDQARWIKRMFQLALKDGQHVVAQKLAAEGFRTAQGTVADGTTIGNIVKDKKVMGWWWPTSQVKNEKTGKRKNVQVGSVKRDVFAAAVTEEVFNAVQRKIEQRRNNEGTPNTGGSQMLNLFAGHTFCAHCGGLVRRYGQANGHRPKLRCSVSRRDINTCSHRGGINYEEEQLRRMITDFRWEDFFRDERKAEEIAQITAEQSKAQEVFNAAIQKVENITSAQDQFIAMGRAWPERLDDDLTAAKEAAAEAQMALDRLGHRLSDTSRQKSGAEAAAAIQERLRDFIVNQHDVATRQEFNDWFASTGLVFTFNFDTNEIELVTGNVITKGKQRQLASSFDTEFTMRELEQDRREGWTDAQILQRELTLWGKHYASNDGKREPLWVQLPDGTWAWWDEMDWDFYDEPPTVFFSGGKLWTSLKKVDGKWEKCEPFVITEEQLSADRTPEPEDDGPEVDYSATDGSGSAYRFEYAEDGTAKVVKVQPGDPPVQPDS